MLVTAPQNGVLASILESKRQDTDHLPVDNGDQLVRRRCRTDGLLEGLNEYISRLQVIVIEHKMCPGFFELFMDKSGTVEIVMA